MSCHWGKLWMAIGWAWIINSAELWNSRDGTSLTLTCESPSVLSQVSPGHTTLSQISHHTIKWWNSDVRQDWSLYVRAFWVFYLFIYAAEFHCHGRVKSAWCYPVQISCFPAHTEDLSEEKISMPEMRGLLLGDMSSLEAAFLFSNPILPGCAMLSEVLSHFQVKLGSDSTECRDIYLRRWL